MSIMHGWLPPTRENWELATLLFSLFPIFTLIQWATDFYPQGKTSITSRFNLPGKIGWALMEIPGPLILAYIMYTLPPTVGLTFASLPVGNKTMAGLYITHYIYRALISPLLLNPSMSPIHPLVYLSSASFNTINAIQLGGWLAGYGPTTVYDWAGRAGMIMIGLILWGWGLMGNMLHDDELREIRRQASARYQTAAEEEARKSGKSVAEIKKTSHKISKHYEVPENYLFNLVFYPHYLCEWFEWAGFWIIGGWYCVPARSFLINEITTMTPRALSGKRWYEEKFGVEKTKGRKAVIPFVL